MVRDRHGGREKRIFGQFADACHLGIRPDSIEKRDPPEPDILCEIEEEGPAAFEMVEIIDKDLARRMRAHFELRKRLREHYESLEPGERADIRERVGDAKIAVTCDWSTSSRVWKQAIPSVMEILKLIDPSFEGEVDGESALRLPRGVSKVRIVRRANLQGPLFSAPAAGSYSDLTVEAIRGKLNRDYKSAAPVELLAYYEFQLDSPSEILPPPLVKFLRGAFPNDCFRRVWVFAVFRGQVLYEYPESLY